MSRRLDIFIERRLFADFWEHKDKDFTLKKHASPFTTDPEYASMLMDYLAKEKKLDVEIESIGMSWFAYICDKKEYEGFSKARKWPLALARAFYEYCRESE